jgi:hypothetical protein
MLVCGPVNVQDEIPVQRYVAGRQGHDRFRGQLIYDDWMGGAGDLGLGHGTKEARPDLQPVLGEQVMLRDLVRLQPGLLGRAVAGRNGSRYAKTKPIVLPGEQFGRTSSPARILPTFMVYRPG